MDFVRFNVQVAAEYSQADLDRIDSQVAAIEASMAEALPVGVFGATPGDHCGWCSLPCPVVDRLDHHPVRILKRVDAERLAGEYLALVQALDARRQALHTYTLLQGDLEVGGALFHHQATQTRKFPAAAVVDALRRQDIEPSFTVGASAVKSYLTARKWAHVKPAIEALGSTRTGSRFTVSRATVAEHTDDEQEG
jgi:hypothetical protein